jgi:hypothetical protein
LPYANWQPKKVMAVLLELDPNADKDSVLAVGIEEEFGVSKDIQALGCEKVLGMAELRKHYDALGSYLHVSTLKQSISGAHPDAVKLRSRCAEIVKFVEAVLASTFYNITLGQFAVVDCQECGRKLRKRIPPGQPTVKIECFECPASYTAADVGGGKMERQTRTARDRVRKRTMRDEDRGLTTGAADRHGLGLPRLPGSKRAGVGGPV